MMPKRVATLETLRAVCRTLLCSEAINMLALVEVFFTPLHSAVTLVTPLHSAVISVTLFYSDVTFVTSL